MEVGEVEVSGRRMRWCVVNVHDIPSMRIDTKAFCAWTENRERSVRLRLAADTPMLTNESAATLVPVADELELGLANGSKVLLVKQWLERPLRLEGVAQRRAKPEGRVWGRWNRAPLAIRSLDNKCIGALDEDEVAKLLESV